MRPPLRCSPPFIRLSLFLPLALAGRRTSHEEVTCDLKLLRSGRNSSQLGIN